MKVKKFAKKLSLNKITISHLDWETMRAARGRGEDPCTSAFTECDTCEVMCDILPITPKPISTFFC